MAYRIVFHPAAAAELEELYDYIAHAASPKIAWDFVSAIRQYCLRFETFPARGIERSDIYPGLRIVGFHRRASIAFTVEGDVVSILGVFYGGRSISLDVLDERRKMPPQDL